MQTFRDWEWLIEDDGSRDGSDARAMAWARRDPRIRARAGAGGGMIALANAAIGEARGDLVARMDADDLARPSRLEEQVAFLDANPAIDVVDSRVAWFGTAPGGGAGMRRYVDWVNGLAGSERGEGESHDAIARGILVESPVIQPAVMLRRSALARIGGYRDGDFPEDYDLWLRLLGVGSRFAKLPSLLLDWRDSPGRLTRTHPRYRPGAFFHRKKEALRALDGGKMIPGGVAVWGAGGGGRPWRRALREWGLDPVFLVDIDPRKIGRVLSGAPVVGPEALRERPWSYLLVVVCARGARDAVREHLQAEGMLDGEGRPVGGREVRFVQ